MVKWCWCPLAPGNTALISLMQFYYLAMSCNLPFLAVGTYTPFTSPLIHITCMYSELLQGRALVPASGSSLLARVCYLDPKHHFQKSCLIKGERRKHPGSYGCCENQVPPTVAFLLWMAWCSFMPPEISVNGLITCEMMIISSHNRPCPRPLHAERSRCNLS